MKKLFKFMLYLFLILIFLAAIAGAAYWTIIIQQWPWWILAVIVASLIGLFLGYFAIKKLLIRKNEKKFVQSVIHEQEAMAQKEQVDESISFKDAQIQWKESINRLKKSHLRKFGNPLYVLPWYIIMGESRSGKTSAIKNSNLNSPLTDVSKAAIVSGTKNCDWWFLEQAIILDTAGRYTIPIEEETDKKEWQTFLTLLSKYRKKEPINGVIVTVAADSLLREDSIELSDKAKSIRQRINQMMSILGAKFPVYLLVTKMDLVNGFTDFCDHIPEQRDGQVMGYINQENETDITQILNQCMETVYRKIRELRTVFIHDRINNFAVSFSNEFMALKPSLEAYMQSLLSHDIYQASPFLRGIYFSSACRKGNPESEFLKQAGIQYNNDTSANRNKSFFLKNFFGAILPSDRNIFKPLSEFLIWQRTTMSLSLFSLMLICLSMSGILAFSYMNNIKALNKFNPKFFNTGSRVSRLTDTVLMLDRQRFEINKLEMNNDNWILPRLGLDHSRSLEKKLKQQFIQDVRKNMVQKMDDLIFENIHLINSQTPYKKVVDCAAYAARRIDVLNDSINREPFSGKKEFEKSMARLFPILDNNLSLEIISKFAPIYYSYLEWNKDKQNKTKKLEKFQSMISELAVKSDNFNWLVSPWVCTTADIFLFDFLKGYSTNQPVLSSQAFVNGAYTKKGRKEIQQFLKLIQKSFPSIQKFERLENDFWAWYSNQFYEAWFDFASAFPVAEKWKSLIENWTELSTLMTTESNPYFMLLAKMADEFEWLSRKTDQQPLWVNAVVTLKKIRNLAVAEKKKEKGSLTAKLTLAKEKITDKLGKKADKAYKAVDSQKQGDLKQKLKFAQVWNDYVKSLKTISPATAYNEKCFQMFSDYFKVLSDPSKQDKPYNLTHDSLLRLRAFLRQSNTSPAVLNLITGPFDYLTFYGVHNTIEYLQKKWENIVLSASWNTDPDNYYAIMFDKNSGVIWKFINKEAAPFLDQSRTGFFAKKAFGHALPFNSSFFDMLDKGRRLTLEHQDEYTVTIQTSPVDVNREAMIRPYSNTLTMECAEEKTELANSNFLETKTFTWKPSTCGDVTLEIEFKDAVIKREYKGKLGFAQFLSDFRDGSKLFNVSDFPEQIGYLTNNKVTDINLSYNISGSKPVLKFLNRRPPVIPEVIFKNFKLKSGKYPVAQTTFPMPEKPAVEPKRFKDSYSLTLDTIPMDVNGNATVKPVAGILWMDCKDRVIRFENNNYPESVSFDWEPEKCGKVILIIHFPDLTLVKEYSDFFEFAKDFSFSSKTFSSSDFPEQKEALLKRGISFITLSYVFKGDLPSLGKKQMQTRAKEKQVETKNQAGPKNGEEPDKDAAPADLNGLGSTRKILQQNPEKYTIQVMLGDSEEEVLEFARKNQLADKAGVYKRLINGQEKYSLIFGSFQTFQTAQQELALLTDSASRYGPWIRKFESIFKEIEEE